MNINAYLSDAASRNQKIASLPGDGLNQTGKPIELPCFEKA